MRSIQKSPTDRQSQPIGLLGRLEAVRAPTMGKARKDTKISSRLRCSRCPPLRSRVGEERKNDGCHGYGQTESGERPGQPRGGAGSHPSASCPDARSGRRSHSETCSGCTVSRTTPTSSRVQLFQVGLIAQLRPELFEGLALHRTCSCRSAGPRTPGSGAAKG